MMKNVTAVLITFLREEYTRECVSSLRKTYPDIKILVAENGAYNPELKKFVNENGGRYFLMPFDSGVCYARNRLVELVETEYVLVSDDDFYFEKETGTEKMVKFLDAHKDISLIGGRVKENGIIRNYQGFINIGKDNLIYKNLDDKNNQYDSSSELMFQKCDLTFNFFVARVKDVRHIKWDEEIKVAYEHADWFISLKKQKINVAYTPDVIVIHKPEHVIVKNAVEYKGFRNRVSDRERFGKKHNLSYTIGLNGRTTNFSRSVGGISDIDFCITTFMRKPALERLLKSIAKFYPDANVIIADQTFDLEYYKKLWPTLEFKNKPTAYKLPFDCGLSYARNFLVKVSKRKYKLILEDDFIFTENTNIKRLKKIADYTGLLTAGSMIQGGIMRHFEHRFKKEGDTLYHIHDGDNWELFEGIRYKRTGCTLNFMLVTKEQWNPELKVYEHTDFFLRYPEAVYVPSVEIAHQPIEDEEYMKLRNRNQYLIKMMDIHNLREIVYLSGLSLRKKFGKLVKKRIRKNAK